jgi:hypothetical protein
MSSGWHCLLGLATDRDVLNTLTPPLVPSIKNIESHLAGPLTSGGADYLRGFLDFVCEANLNRIPSASSTSSTRLSEVGKACQK